MKAALMLYQAAGRPAYSQDVPGTCRVCGRDAHRCIMSRYGHFST